MTTRNRCDARIASRLAAAFVFAAAALATSQAPAAAQITVAGGYTYMPGRIGDARSEHGPTLRLDLRLVSNRWARLSVEGSVDRLNQSRIQGGNDACLLPGNVVGRCNLDIRNRDLVLTGAVVTRFGPQGSGVNPYLLVGAGVTSVRTKLDQVGTDNAGNVLPNFTVSGTSTDGGLVAPLGAGVAIPWGGRAFTIEARATPILHNYSGGPQFNVIPSLTVGLRF
ncbi:MAG: outer membrane beta-barrel protein [Gemmatimonadales bacterium]|nr:outer membrane beta-barrel protein [Gemmatimonadales bacterium]